MLSELYFGVAITSPLYFIGSSLVPGFTVNCLSKWILKNCPACIGPLAFDVSNLVKIWNFFPSKFNPSFPCPTGVGTLSSPKSRLLKFLKNPLFSVLLSFLSSFMELSSFSFSFFELTSCSFSSLIGVLFSSLLLFLSFSSLLLFLSFSSCFSFSFLSEDISPELTFISVLLSFLFSSFFVSFLSFCSWACFFAISSSCFSAFSFSAFSFSCLSFCSWACFVFSSFKACRLSYSSLKFLVSYKLFLSSQTRAKMSPSFLISKFPSSSFS